MKQIEEMKKYVKKNWKEMAKKTAMVCAAGGVCYAVYKLTGKKPEKGAVEGETKVYKILEVPESAKNIIAEAWDCRENAETVIVSSEIRLSDLGDVGKAIVDAYSNIDPDSLTVATIEVAC